MVAWPVKAATATNLISFMLRHVFHHFGIPHKLIMDYGSAMMAHTFLTFLRGQGIEHQPTMAYHQQANVLVERVIQTLKTMI